MYTGRINSLENTTTWKRYKFSVAPGSHMNTQIIICQPHSSTPQLIWRTGFLSCVWFKDNVVGLTHVFSVEVSIQGVIKCQRKDLPRRPVYFSHSKGNVTIFDSY